MKKNFFPIFVIVSTLVVPSLFAENSIGFRFGYHFLTGDREDEFVSDGIYVIENWYDPFIDSSFHGRMDMDASDYFLGAELNVALPFHRSVLFSPCVEYFRNTVDYDIFASIYWRDPPDATWGSRLIVSTDEVDYSLLSLILNMKYIFFKEEGRRLSPYAGGGIGFHRWSIELERHSTGSWVYFWNDEPTHGGSFGFEDIFKNNGTSFGAQMLGGVGFNLNSFLEPFIELQYRFVRKAKADLFVEQEELPPMHTLNNEILTADFSGLQIAGGLRVKF